jgi:hypothetical protein
VCGLVFWHAETGGLIAVCYLPTYMQLRNAAVGLTVGEAGMRSDACTHMLQGVLTARYYSSIQQHHMHCYGCSALNAR